GDEALLPAPADLAVGRVKGKPAETPPDEPPKVERVGRFRVETRPEAGAWSHPLALLAPYVHENGAWVPWAGEEPASAARWYLTPTFSAAGAWPPGFAPDRLEGPVPPQSVGRRYRLVAAAVDGFVTVGGWDLQRFEPKTLRRALSPGATFVFEPADPPTDPKA